MFCIHLLQQADMNCMKLTEGCDPNLQVKCQHDAAIFTRKVKMKKLLHSRSNMKTTPTFWLLISGAIMRSFLGQTANQKIWLNTVRQCGKRTYSHFQQKTQVVLAHYAQAQKFLPKNKTPVLPQPSHTQDLSPADIFLFPKL
jgi:hypothetical protein